MQIKRQVFISQDANGLESLMFTGSCNHHVSPTDGGWWRLLKTIGCILIIALLALVFLWVSRNGKPWFVPHVTSVYMCKKVHLYVYHDMHMWQYYSITYFKCITEFDAL